MAASKTIADYEDAVRRIVDAHVGPGSTTREAVRRDLRRAGAPQITPEVIDGIVANVLTEDRVVEAIEASGELPSRSEIDAITSVSDDYDMRDRVDEVADRVRDRVATVEDVEEAIADRRRPGRPTFREEVDTAVAEVAGRREFVGEAPDEVAREQALEIGAPRESNFRRASAQTVARAESITPADVLDTTSAQTPVQVIRDSSGNAVAATGGPREEIGREVAESIGAPYMSTEEVVESMNVAGSGERVDLTLGGAKVGEVDVE